MRAVSALAGHYSRSSTAADKTVLRQFLPNRQNSGHFGRHKETHAIPNQSLASLS
jgi:hypothetical protein